MSNTIESLGVLSDHTPILVPQFSSDSPQLDVSLRCGYKRMY